MKKTTSHLAILLISSTFLSCSSLNFIKLRPIEQESIFADGKEIVKKEDNGLKIVASYDGNYHEYMVFDVEVFNNTDSAITISPKDFRAFPLDAEKQNLLSDNGQSIIQYEGIEPSEEINVVQQKMDYQEKKLKRAKTVNTILFVGGLFTMLASSSSHKNGERFWRSANVDIGQTMLNVSQIKRIADHEEFYSKMNKLEHEYNTWSNEGFRATTLAPHTSIRGGVFIEANTQAKFVQINYFSQTHNIDFLFEQSFVKK